MRRYLEQFFYTIPDEAVREQQAEQFALERESLERHRAEAKRMVAHLLRRDARILVMDVSHGGLVRFSPNGRRLTMGRPRAVLLASGN